MAATATGRPRLNGASVVGVRPGTPFLYAVAATGARPRSFSAPDLPDGLVLDSATGRITGTVSEPGQHVARLAVENEAGRVEGSLRIVAGDRLALTPPMGWMSWNMFGPSIDEALIRETADAMVVSGMRDVGYEYVCIDDHWHGGRDTDGRLYPDPAKFPDGIASLADYVHERGLKLGIYSDAGTMTCGGEPGSVGFERQDAETFASWEVDYLKYDYCHAPPDRPTAMERYTTMGRALRETGRSIVFAVCEWGVREPWLWAAEAGGHLWRTTPDITDAWTVADDPQGFVGILDSLDRQVGLEQYAGRGWHDPDMLIVGLHGRGLLWSRAAKPGCTDTEYRSQMSVWSIVAAPLLASCDLRSMDETTVETLTNAELLAISQDPLGLPGRRIGADGGIEIWARPLDADAVAFAFLNRADDREEAVVSFERLGLSGPQHVRDVWAHEDLGVLEGSLTQSVEPHATNVLVCSPATTGMRADA